MTEEIEKIPFYNKFVEQRKNINKDLVLVCGQNGSGKTNILESISLYDSPNGFKGSSLNEIINH